jgi:hypothetical protein
MKGTQKEYALESLLENHLEQTLATWLEQQLGCELSLWVPHLDSLMEDLLESQ